MPSKYGLTDIGGSSGSSAHRDTGRGLRGSAYVVGVKSGVEDAQGNVAVRVRRLLAVVRGSALSLS
jgi:hypothetical protein